MSVKPRPFTERSPRGAHRGALGCIDFGCAERDRTITSTAKPPLRCHLYANTIVMEPQGVFGFWDFLCTIRVIGLKQNPNLSL
jgi:hypothetical protein